MGSRIVPEVSIFDITRATPRATFTSSGAHNIPTSVFGAYAIVVGAGINGGSNTGGNAETFAAFDITFATSGGTFAACGGTFAACDIPFAACDITFAACDISFAAVFCGITFSTEGNDAVRGGDSGIGTNG